MQRKAQFARPEPGFSLYEGRTRGKRMKYTFSDEEDETSDALSTRRSTRRGSPIDNRPVVTASGRQVRSRVGGVYGESLLTGLPELDSPATGEYERSDASEGPNGRATRSGRSGRNGVPQRSHRKHIAGYNSIDEMDDEDEIDEWDGGDDDEDDDMKLEDDEEDSVSEEESDGDNYIKPKGSLVVTLRIRGDRLAAASSPPQQPSSPPPIDEQTQPRMEIDNASASKPAAPHVGQPAPNVDINTQPANYSAQPVSKQISAELKAKLPSPPASITLKPEQPELNGKQDIPVSAIAENTPTTNGHSVQQPLYTGQTAAYHAPGIKAQDAAMPDAPAYISQQ